MTELSRFGFLILGLYLALSPLSQIISYALFRTPDGSPALVVAISAWVVVSLLPGLILIWKSRALAVWLYGSADESVPEFDTTTVIAAALAVLGVWLVVGGLSMIAAAVATLFLSGGIAGTLEILMGNATRGTIQAGLGVLVTFKSKALGIWLGDRLDKPAA